MILARYKKNSTFKLEGKKLSVNEVLREPEKRRMIWIIGLLTIITVILGFIALMVWAIGDKISQK